MLATKGERFSYDGNPRWEVADRSFLNLMEQTPLFNAILWLHAIFVDAQLAGILGLCAVGARLLYPILRSVFLFLMEFSTQGYWFCVMSLWANLGWKILVGEALLTVDMLGTTSGFKMQGAMYLGMNIVSLPIVALIFLALKWAPYKMVATTPKAKEE